MAKSAPDLQQAQDTATTPKQLQKLAESNEKAVRRAVAKNPNTSFETLCTLGKEFPRELVENPSLPLLLLEDPNLMERIPDETMAKILQLEDVPDFFLEKIDYGVIRDALRLRKLPAKVIEAILAWGNRDENEYSKKEIFAKLASHPSATAKVLLALTKGYQFEIHEGVSKNKNATPEVLLRLFSYSSQDIVLRNIAQHPNATEALQWRARTSSINFFPDQMKKEIDAKLSAEHKKLLASLDTKEHTLRKRSLTEEQRTMLQQGGLRAKFLLVHDLGCSEERLRAITFDPTHSQWDHTNLLPMILRHPNTTDALREEMYKTKRVEFRQALAESPQTKPELLQKLATDRDTIARGSVAKNENTPLDCLKALAKDKEVGWYVAENPNINEELFELMASAKHTQHTVAKHERCPAHILLQLAASSDVDVIRGLTDNPATPAEAFRIICEKKHWRKDNSWRPILRRYMSEHPSFPKDLLPTLKKRS